MSARLAEALAKVAQLQADLGEAYTELSALYDVEGAKSGKAGGDGAAGKGAAKGASGKAVAPKGKPVAEDDTDVSGDADGDEDDLPEPTAPTKADTKKPAPAKKAAPAKSAGKAKKVTEDDVRALAKAVIEKFDKDTAVAILSEFGDGKLADVDEDDYAACAAKLQEKLDEEEGGEAEADDDI